MNQGHQKRLPFWFKVGVGSILILHVLTHSVNSEKVPLQPGQSRLSIAPTTSDDTHSQTLPWVITKVTIGSDDIKKDKDPSNPEEANNNDPSLADTFTFQFVEDPEAQEIIMISLKAKGESETSGLVGQVDVPREMLPFLQEATVICDNCDGIPGLTVRFIVELPEDDDATLAPSVSSSRLSVEGLQVDEKNFCLEITVKNGWNPEFVALVTLPDWGQNKLPGEQWSLDPDNVEQQKLSVKEVPGQEKGSTTFLLDNIVYYGIADHRPIKISFHNGQDEIGKLEHEYSVVKLLMRRKRKAKVQIQVSDTDTEMYELIIKTIVGTGTNKMSYLTIGGPQGGFSDPGARRLINPLGQTAKLFGWGTHPIWPTMTFTNNDFDPQSTGIHFSVEIGSGDDFTTEEAGLTVSSWETLSSKDPSKAQSPPTGDLQYSTCSSHPAMKYLQRKDVLLVPTFHDYLRITEPTPRSFLDKLGSLKSPSSSQNAVPESSDLTSNGVDSTTQTNESPNRKMAEYMITSVAKFLGPIARNGLYFRTGSNDFNRLKSFARKFDSVTNQLKFKNSATLIESIYGANLPEKDVPVPTDDAESFNGQDVVNMALYTRPIIGYITDRATSFATKVATTLNNLADAATKIGRALNLHLIASETDTEGKVKDLKSLFPDSSFIVFDFEKGADNSKLNDLDQVFIIPVPDVVKKVFPDLGEDEPESVVRDTESDEMYHSFMVAIMNLVVGRIEMAVARHGEKWREFVKLDKLKRKRSEANL